MGRAALTPVGFSGARLDLTVPSAQAMVSAPSPYARDGRIEAWSLPPGRPLSADLGHARFVTDLAIRVYASQASTLRVQVDGALAASVQLAAGETRTLTREDLPGLPWTLQTLRLDASCQGAHSACALVPGLRLNLLPPRDPGAGSTLLAGALLCAAALALAWRFLFPAGRPR